MARGVLTKSLLWGLALGFVALVALVWLGKWREVQAALAGFPLRLLAGTLTLAFVNYLIRCARWVLYLGRLGFSVPWRQSVSVFFAGLAFSVSPGKAGELVKSYLLKSGAGIEMRRSAAVVVMERVTDFAGVLLLAAAGAAAFGHGHGRAVLLGSAALLVSLTLLASSSAVLEGVLRFMPARFGALRDSQAALRVLLAPRILVPSLALAVMAWFAECLGFWLVLQGLAFPVGLPVATFVYVFATLVGSLTLLPGGLLTTEGSMVALLTLFDVDRTTAASATLLIRFCTLWFAVLVGLVALWVWGRVTGVSGGGSGLDLVETQTETEADR